jgi:hypothetical protein
VRTRSQIAARWVATGMAVCAFAAAPARSQIRQTNPEAQLACQMFDQASGMRPVLASALAGDAEAFPKLEQHMLALRTLVDGKLPPSLGRLEPLVRSMEYSAKVLLQKPHVMPTVQNVLHNVIRESLLLVSQAQEIAANERKGRQVPSRVAAAQQLPLLLDSLSKSAGRAAGPEMFPEAVFDLGRNLNDIRTLTSALTVGNAELKIPAVSNAQQRARLQKLTEDFAPVLASAGQALGKLQEYVTANYAITHLQKASSELVLGVQPVCYAPGIRVEPRR